MSNNTAPTDLPWDALLDNIRALAPDDRLLLSTSLAVLQMDLPSNDDLDSLTVRRELAAASIAPLGSFWDNEVDRAWQDFQP